MLNEFITGLKKVIKCSLAFIVLLIAATTIFAWSKDNGSSNISTQSASTLSFTNKAHASPVIQQQTEKRNWHYSASENEMTGKNLYLARTESLNSVNFGFPYQGKQTANLTLRTHPQHGKDLMLTLAKAHFLCPSYKGCSVLVRFDDKKPVRYSANPPSDHSNNTLFISNYSKFAGQMLKAKTVRIQAEFYKEGNVIFEFDVEGFDVKKYRPE